MEGGIVQHANSMIQVNQTVILIDNKSYQKTIQVKKNRKFKAGKLVIPCEQLIGLSYGSYIEIITKNKTEGEVKFREDYQDIKGQGWQNEDEGVQIENDNRDFQDTNQAQKLTAEQIQEMKKNLDGEQIIDSLIAQSDTFNNRTKFSQQKYIMKKKAKYLIIFQLVKPTPLTLCNLYCNHSPDKINFLRGDTLSLIVQKAHPESNTLIIENTMGLVTGSILYRVNGKQKVSRMFLEYSNIPNLNTQTQIMLDLNDTYFSTLTYINYQLIKNEMSLFKNQYSSCILCHSGFTPLSLFKIVIPFLIPSAHIVAYSQYVENLIELVDYLRETKQGVLIQIDNLILREWQVLPSRTHPQYSELGSTGYVLSFDFIE